MDKKLRERLNQYYLPEEIEGLGIVIERLQEFGFKTRPVGKAIADLGPRISNGGRYKRPVLEYLTEYARRVENNSSRGLSISVRPKDLLDVLKEHYPFIGKKGPATNIGTSVGTRTHVISGQRPGYGPK